MEYRTLGATGLEVSVLGFGASPLGGAFGPIDEAEGIRAVHAALDAGVNYLDVAPYYGETRAETVLGRALQGCARDRYILATKVGHYSASAFDFSSARVVASVEESLQRLGVDHIDLIQCHDIEFVALNQIVEETIPTLERLREQGKVRFIGITGLPLTIFPYVIDRARVDAVLSYCRCTLADRSLTGLLPYFQHRNLGIINASPLCMGLLTEQGPPDWHPAPQALRSTSAAAAAYCSERGHDLATLALQFALADPRIAVTLVGIADTMRLQRNLACVGAPPDPDLLTGVEAILGPTQGMTWPSGLPENQEIASS